MNPSEVFLDSSILVGLNLGDENAKALVKSLIERGFTLVINPVVFSETAYKVMFTLALRDELKGFITSKSIWIDMLGFMERSKESIEQLQILRNSEIATFDEDFKKVDFHRSY
ncbi:PIN domain-containing protein [Pyrococcus furiosus DSM 3638]|uniref:PIN domain-containing protein n=3 Tax=Pyrococcus furiosus TaxID=2261 RepID=Q8U395_PYRFU|nr:PIN domain-containing protein [Pyrococcus furiosus]AAL80699.1 hypothetical protein PF0575 [Pyrococcus furiosus DSM 3638]AFN03368.1 hypothetical protein PFC_02005 [Pyrococcus furiosus COM1]QEK78282.1 PIN domain-containing protein [Pyrococcus furiosus DSM 3638]